MRKLEKVRSRVPVFVETFLAYISGVHETGQTQTD